MPTLANGDYVSPVFSRYAMPSDDLAGTATSVVVSDSSPEGSHEDPEYPGTNLIAPTATGHLNLPSRPAKLLTNDGYWELVFAAPITAQVVHLVYHNFDSGLDVTLEPDGGTPIAITIPPKWDNGWTQSPSQAFAPQTSDRWRLSINAGNSILPQVGRILLYGSGGLRDLGTDAQWGVVEDEEQGQIEHVTEAGVETLYELFGPRRALDGTLGLRTSETTEFYALARDARNRILPWTLLPDVDVPADTWFVRFTEPTIRRTRDMIEHNLFPFRVRELSRGLPWP